MSLGLLTRASSGWRRVIGIADQGVVWVALCHWIAGQGVVWVALCYWDCWAGHRVGGAMSLGLRGRASFGWRRVIGIAWDC